MFRAEKEEVLDLTPRPARTSSGESYERADRRTLRHRRPRPSRRPLAPGHRAAGLAHRILRRTWASTCGCGCGRRPRPRPIDVFAANLQGPAARRPGRPAPHDGPGPRLPHRRARSPSSTARARLSRRTRIYPHVAAAQVGRVAAHPGAPGRDAPGRAHRHRQRHRVPRDRQARHATSSQAQPGSEPHQDRGLRGRRLASTPPPRYAATELPELDVSLRGAVSIARRLQDPLAELVKIDPKSIGVGQYQHDVHRHQAGAQPGRRGRGLRERGRRRRQHRLRPAAGPGVAASPTAWRARSSPTATRTARSRPASSCMDVPRLGPKAFEQAPGFLRIRGGDDPLDASGVHPEPTRWSSASSARPAPTCPGSSATPRCCAG